MNIKKLLNKLLFLLLTSSVSLEALEFSWKIEGSLDQKLLETIKNNAPLASKEDNIISLNALCQLSDNQADLWRQEFQSRGYYEASVEWNLDHEQTPVSVTFQVDCGPLYYFEEVEILWSSTEYVEVSPQELGIEVGAPALPSAIFDAEEQLLHLMALKGYPLAKIANRNVFADQKNQSVRVVFSVDSCSKVRFGETSISGNTSVDESFIWQKIAWKKGRGFTPNRIERTQEDLEATGLFSSVVIKEGTELDSDGNIPMDITLTEAKHRTVAAGFGYSTQQGLGLSGEWQHRNFRGMGERLNVEAKWWTAVQTGKLEYMIPGFQHSNQDLRFIFEAEHEKTKGYTETALTTSVLLDKRINDWTFLSYGTSYTHLRSTHSDNNGAFNLFKLPLQLKWTTANDILDPTQGMTLNAKTIPSFQIGSNSFGYWINTATGTLYHALNEDESLVFASKITTGTILGASKKEIPPSERFYSGTENTLRGYRFMSVSPLDSKNKPTGGRSMLILSNEIRWSCTDTIGLAAFYEIGNVYSNPVPDFKQGQLQSAGAGIRYRTPVGPIRFDVAVPLNRRKDVDPPCQFYMSIGQAF